MDRVNEYTATVIEAAQAAGIPHGWELWVTRRSRVSMFRRTGPERVAVDQVTIEMFYGSGNRPQWRMKHGPDGPEPGGPWNKPDNLGWSSWWDNLSQALIDIAGCFDRPPPEPTYANGPGLRPVEPL